MKFTVFHEENWRYSIMDLYLYKLLHILTLRKSKRIMEKIEVVESYLEGMRKVY